ncbi:acyl-CoA thioester hydrolase/BAAT C-terminal domain-containing protein [Streptosporangium sp. OZ121]|uniref:acyl-CoA thioesterase/bile acid-CoA:amino acid N-acyltransferase family protein n=1 Tax=Streptosporangium sp. OZ121 TaxID=3444183 RepID=UPI003F798B98
MLSILVALMGGTLVAAPAQAATPPEIRMPASALADEVFTTKITGLAPNATVTLKAEMSDDLPPTLGGPRLWRSSATFTADTNGEVNLAHDAPLTGGSYTGAQKMGLFYSMRIVGEETQSTFGFNKFGATPTTFTFSASVGGSTVATKTFVQHFSAPGVSREVIDEDGVKGVLYRADGTEDHPAVIYVTGSDGGVGLMSENRAALLASHGYTTLALAYFNYPGLPSTLTEIPLEYIGNAVDWLKDQDGVSDFVAFSGASRGGELALLAGATFDSIDAVIAISPSGVVWPSVPSNLSVVEPSWTLGGLPLTYVDESLSRDDLIDLMEDNEGTGAIVPLRPYFEDALAADPNSANAEIPVEQTNGPILLISGEDDQLWPSTALANISNGRLQASTTYSFPYRHRSYEGAGHIILVPNQPTTYNHYLGPAPYNNYLGLGGTPEADHNANRKAWKRTLEFLAAAVAAH